MELDEAIAAVDPRSRQQNKYILVINSHALPGTLIVLCMVFIGYAPPTFECHRDGVNGTESLNSTCFNGTAASCECATICRRTARDSCECATTSRCTTRDRMPWHG